MRTHCPDSQQLPRLDELRHLFQPVVPLTGTDGWSEALVRWQLPDGTVRGPLDILPYWFTPQRLDEFTRFSLDRAGRAAVANPTARLSVNLSPAQLLLPGTLATLEGMLPSVRCRLHIELTEQVYVDGGALADRLRLLKERCGVVLLDDVTPTDLATRTRFDAPVDGVKVDRTVILALLGVKVPTVSQEVARRFIGEVTRDFAIVVAEGIEDPNACEELAALGVSHVQGFGIARPAPELRSEASVAALTRRTEGLASRGRLSSAGIGMTADDKPTGWSSR